VCRRLHEVRRIASKSVEEHEGSGTEPGTVPGSAPERVPGTVPERVPGTVPGGLPPATEIGRSQLCASACVIHSPYGCGWPGAAPTQTMRVEGASAE
jgi:hypothetical protein